MELKLKPISKDGITQAISRIQLYRYLNEPEEAESICRDILAVEPDHQMAVRLLAMTISDQFSGDPSDRFSEAEGLLNALTDPYERLYFTGLLY